MNRIHWFQSNISKEMRGLEIGPSYRPIFPKRDGWNVAIVDHLDKNLLIKKYSAWGVPTESIEEVDYVIGPKSLTEFLPKAQLDYVIASHVIEHIPNPIKFLNDISTILVRKGLLRMAVPDKRFCFDVLKPCSTIGHMIQAFAENRTRHTFAQYLDALIMHTKYEGEITFSKINDPNKLEFAHSLDQSYQKSCEERKNPSPMDVHGWIFTPSSFLAILTILNSLNFIDLTIETIVPDGHHEFLVELRKDSEKKYQPNKILKSFWNSMVEESEIVKKH